MTVDELKRKLDCCIVQAMALQVRSCAYSQENMARAMLNQAPARDAAAFHELADQLSELSEEMAAAVSEVDTGESRGPTDL